MGKVAVFYWRLSMDRYTGPATGGSGKLSREFTQARMKEAIDNQWVAFDACVTRGAFDLGSSATRNPLGAQPCNPVNHNRPVTPIRESVGGAREPAFSRATF